MHVRRLAVLFVAALVLAACSSPPPAGPASVRGSVAPSEEYVFGVGLAFRSAAMVMSELQNAAVFEVEEGFYVTAIAPLDADGAFSLALPDHADVPDDHLVPAETFLYNVVWIDGCTLEASDASALVSFHLFELLTFPGLYAVTESGPTLAIASDAAIDTTLPEDVAFADRPILAWLYADKAVTIASDGDGCSDPMDGTLDVDLTLARGWNQVAWTIDFDADVLTLTNDATAAPVVTVLPMN